ncbi:MAG: caspase family protein [Flavobacteriaceae bacterium]
MMKNLLLCSSFLIVFVLHAQQEFVVQSNHSESISQAALDTKRGILVTYGYMDKTLKFWEEKTGLLYKTLDFTNSITAIEINEAEGKAYVLATNTISVFSTETFEKLKDYPLGRIYAIHFLQFQGKGRLVLFARDQNYMTALYALDEASGTFQAAGMPPFPGEGEVNYFRFTPDGKRAFISSNYGDNYLFSTETGEYKELNSDIVAMFNNGDVLRAIYDMEANRAVFMRLDASRKVLWNKSFAIEVDYEGILMPTIFDVTLTNDSKKFWIHTTFLPLTQLHAETGEVVGNFSGVENAFGVIDAGNYIYAQLTYNGNYGRYKIFDNKPLAVYGNNVIEPTQLVSVQNGDGIELLFSGQYGINTYSLLVHPKVTQLTEYKTNYRDDFSSAKMIPDPTSNKVYAVTQTIDPIKVFKRGEANSFEDLIENYKDVRHSGFSPNTKLLATISSNELRVINTETKTEIFNKPIRTEVGFFDNSFSLSPFNNTVAYTTAEIHADQVFYDKLHYFDFGAKNEKWTKDGKYFAIFHINGGKELLVCNSSANKIEILDVASGNVKKSFQGDFQGLKMDGYLSPNEDYLLLSGFTIGVLVYHIPTGKMVQSFKMNNYGKFSGDFVSNTIIATPESGGIKFIDYLNQKELARLYVFEDKSWVAYTPEGLFDGSQEGWDKVTFIKNKKTIPLESVFDKFYTPRLLYQILGEKEFKSNVNLENMAPPPSLSLTYKQGSRNLYVDDDSVTEITVENATGKVLLEASTKGDKIKEIRLYQNGKLVGNNTRNLFVDDDNQDPNKKELDVQLMEGLNEFSAVAVNTQGTESAPEKLNVNYIPKQQSLIKPQGIQAHLLIIGIDEYQNSKYNLNYAVADATGFKESLESGLTNITSKTHVYFIKNNEAIRDNILSKIMEIASMANPQDIFIFYYAGHGVMSGTSEFFLVPNDVTQLYGDDGALQQKGIAASELKKIASGILAQKQLYILDACQSAGALATVAARGAVEEKAIAQLARSTGTHWLTASGSQQFATEFDELGHGVFTYALLEALSGKADSGDKRVTVNELKAYLESRVPEISEKYKGSPQYPSSFGFGQDFPVSINH